MLPPPPAAATLAPPASPNANLPAIPTHQISPSPGSITSWSTPARFSWADACDEEEDGEFVPDSPLAQIQPQQKQTEPGNASIYVPP